MNKYGITKELAWDIYNFIDLYKKGLFFKNGIQDYITLQVALDNYFDFYCEFMRNAEKEEKEEKDNI